MGESSQWTDSGLSHAIELQSESLIYMDNEIKEDVLLLLLIDTYKRFVKYEKIPTGKIAINNRFCL